MTTTTLTSKGQATIPKEIRDFLGIKPQERVAFSIDGGQVILKRASYNTREAAGCLKSPGIKPFPTKEQIEEISAQAGIARHSNGGA